MSIPFHTCPLRPRAPRPHRRGLGSRTIVRIDAFNANGRGRRTGIMVLTTSSARIHRAPRSFENRASSQWMTPSKRISRRSASIVSSAVPGRYSACRASRLWSRRPIHRPTPIGRQPHIGRQRGDAAGQFADPGDAPRAAHARNPRQSVPGDCIGQSSSVFPKGGRPLATARQ